MKNQNKKILSIDERTLIVGADVAKEIHFARAQDFRGIEYSKPFKFDNSRKGFLCLLNWMKNLMEKHQKTKVIFGMEPTGHYWFPIGWFLHQQKIKVVLVNPYHVKKSKELDDNSPTKNDIKDARTIAQLVKDGRYSEPNMLEGVYAELRVAINHRDHLTKNLTRIKCRIQRWFDIYFPEYHDVFKDWDGKASLVTLKNFPLPKDIRQLNAREIVIQWRVGGVKGAVGLKRATQLIEKSKDSIGLTEGNEMARFELHDLIAQYEIISLQMENLMSKIQELLKQIPGTKEMLTTPGVGIVTVSGFLAEVGDLSKYGHWKQISRLAGFNLKENSSGKHKGETHITKRGRRKLRALLYKCVLMILIQNPHFRALHQYLINRKENPLKRKQSMIAICSKLIRVLYTLGTKQVAYDEKKVLGAYREMQIQAAVA